MENFNIIEERENPLFKRREIKFTINSEVAPSYAIVRKIISEKFSTSEENIRIKKILGTFGSNNFTVSANIYESESDKLSVEGKSKKDFVKEEPKPEEPAETPSQDTQEPLQSKESSNESNQSNEPVSEQTEPKPEEKKE